LKKETSAIEVKKKDISHQIETASRRKDIGAASGKNERRRMGGSASSHGKN